jgi:alkaline phosphatase D
MSTSESGLGRRAFLKTVGAASVLSVGGCADDGGEAAAFARAAAALATESPGRVFQHGVASGDPLADRVVLWTRVTHREADDPDAAIAVTWIAARDPALTDVVASGSAVAIADSDFTVKVDAALPEAGTTYYYRFDALGTSSPVGRTRTAPRQTDHLRIAVVSCSSIWSGFMNGYDRLADRNDLDLVIHCGDYCYDELDPDEQVRPPVDATDWTKPRGLAGWRRRYAYYRLDRQTRRVHQCHPIAVTWDNHDLAIDGDVHDAIRAFHEWTPTRAPEPGRPERIFRTLP